MLWKCLNKAWKRTAFIHHLFPLPPLRDYSVVYLLSYVSRLSVPHQKCPRSSRVGGGDTQCSVGKRLLVTAAPGWLPQQWPKKQVRQEDMKWATELLAFISFPRSVKNVPNLSYAYQQFSKICSCSFLHSSSISWTKDLIGISS